MDDLISRQAALDITWEEPSYTDALNVLTEVRDKVKALPSVKPQEPKTGHWFAWKPEDDVWRTTCSECGEETRTLWNYCPNCGCRMVDSQEARDKE